MIAPKHEARVVQCRDSDGDVLPGVHCPHCNAPGMAEWFCSTQAAQGAAEEHSTGRNIEPMYDEAEITVDVQRLADMRRTALLNAAYMRRAALDLDQAGWDFCTEVAAHADQAADVAARLIDRTTTRQGEA